MKRYTIASVLAVLFLGVGAFVALHLVPDLPRTTSVLSDMGTSSAFAATPSLLPLSLDLESSAADYNMIDDFVLTATLRNNSTGSVTVNSFWIGNLRFRIQRDGVVVKGFKNFASFEQDPRVLQESHLVTLPPGGTVRIPFQVTPLNAGGALLKEILFTKKGPLKTRTYELLQPGDYQIRAKYKYRGPAGGREDVFRGSVVSNTVTFRFHE